MRAGRGRGGQPHGWRLQPLRLAVLAAVLISLPLLAGELRLRHRFTVEGGAREYEFSSGCGDTARDWRATLGSAALGYRLGMRWNDVHELVVRLGAGVSPVRAEDRLTGATRQDVDLAFTALVGYHHRWVDVAMGLYAHTFHRSHGLDYNLMDLPAYAAFTLRVFPEEYGYAILRLMDSPLAALTGYVQAGLGTAAIPRTRLELRMGFGAPGRGNFLLVPSAEVQITDRVRLGAWAVAGLDGYGGGGGGSVRLDF